MSEAIDKLTAELAKFVQVEATLAAAVEADVAARQADAAKIVDLTNQLAAISNGDPAIGALVDQFDVIADKLTADAQKLQSIVPVATPPAQTP